MPVATLKAVAVDCADPRALIAFYRGLVGGEVAFDSDDFVALQGAGGVWLTAHRVERHRAPDWPAGDVGKQLHLDLAVDDLDEAQAAAVALGGTVPAEQPAPDRWRVLLDPAGHPFCVSTMLPKDLEPEG